MGDNSPASTADQKKGQGSGTGAGGGIKPVGAIIIDEDGVRVEAIKGAMKSLVETIGEAAAHAIDRTSKREDKDQA